MLWLLPFFFARKYMSFLIVSYIVIFVFVLKAKRTFFSCIKRVAGSCRHLCGTFIEQKNEENHQRTVACVCWIHPTFFFVDSIKDVNVLIQSSSFVDTMLPGYVLLHLQQCRMWTWKRVYAVTALFFHTCLTIPLHYTSHSQILLLSY